MIYAKESPLNDRVVLQIKGIEDATRRGIRQAFFQYGDELKKTANRQVLQKPKSGRVYRVRRGRTTRRHVASAPGESPANLSGNYRRTIGYKIHGSRSMDFGAGSKSVAYAKFLEEGTRRMLPRPGLGNAVRATERNARQYFINNIRRAVKG